MDIVVWFGKLSKLTQNKKTTLFAEKINKLERKNKATSVHEIFPSSVFCAELLFAIKATQHFHYCHLGLYIALI